VCECVCVTCCVAASVCVCVCQNVAIRKVKVLKAPKFDLTKLMDVHGDYTEEVRHTSRQAGAHSKHMPHSA
jgi:hypothetical protein